MTGSSDRVIVVGAGIVGIACAHYLSESGFEVVVIDKGTIGGACSFGNCGYVCPSHVLPLTEPGIVGVALRSLFDPNAAFRVKPQLRLDLIHWFLQFARRCTHDRMLAAGESLQAILKLSQSEYRQFFATNALDAEWSDKGLLYVLNSTKGFDEFAATNELLATNFDLSADVVTGSQLNSFDPALRSGLAGGYHYKGDASLRPDKLCSDWSHRLAESGVEFIEHCEFESLEKPAGRISGLTTSRGKMSADHYVFAAGAWSGKLAAELDCKIPVEPAKGYSVTIPKPAASAKYPMLFPEHRVGITPFNESIRIGSMMEFAGFDSSIPRRRIDQLYESANNYLTSPLIPSDEQTWYGWRPMTWDSLPVIGRIPKLENAILATGHNMLGVSLATGTGKIVAELMTEKTPSIDPLPYSVSRF